MSRNRERGATRLALATLTALTALDLGCGASTTADATSGDASLDGDDFDATDATEERARDDARAPPRFHRADDAQCRAPAPAGNCVCAGGCPDPPFSCTEDAQCVDAGPGARCISPGGPAGCGCTYDVCAGDDDCGAGETCACHGSPYTFSMGSRCVPGNCRVDAECGVGRHCSPSPASTCGDAGYLCLGYYCHTGADLCVDDDDCDSAANTCVYSVEDGRWECRFYAPPL